MEVLGSSVLEPISRDASLCFPSIEGVGLTMPIDNVSAERRSPCIYSEAAHMSDLIIMYVQVPSNTRSSL